MLKTAVSSVKNGGFSFKKQRFLKLIHILIGIKKIYHVDFQSLSYNTKNKRFFAIKRQFAGKYRLYVWSEQSFC